MSQICCPTPHIDTEIKSFTCCIITLVQYTYYTRFTAVGVTGKSFCHFLDLVRLLELVERVNPVFQENHALPDTSMKLWKFAL